MYEKSEVSGAKQGKKQIPQKNDEVDSRYAAKKLLSCIL